MKQCLFCKNDFEPKRPKQKFCSAKCRVYFSREDISEGGFIYCLRNPLENNKIFYVGKTMVSLDKRLQGHKSNLKNGKKDSVIKSILEAGEEVIIEQIEMISNDSITETEKYLNEREIFWIKEISAKGDLTNSYLKKMRTKPHTVRFDSDKLKLALKKAETDKVQKMVDEAVDVFLDAEKVIVSVNPEKLLEPLNADEYLTKEIKVGFAPKEENKRYKIVNGKKVFK